MPSKKTDDAPKVAIIEQRPTGDRCLVTVPAGNDALLQSWLTKVRAGAKHPIVTKPLGGPALSVAGTGSKTAPATGDLMALLTASVAAASA